MIKIHQLKHYTWLEVIRPNPDEAQTIVSKYQLPRKFKNYMLDRHEQPRATFNINSNFDVLVTRAVAFDKSHRSATTPLFMCFSKEILITVVHTFGVMHLFSRIPLKPDDQLYNQVFRLLQRIQQPYFTELDDVMNKAESLSHPSSHKITQQKLNELTALKSRLVYLRSATAGNLIALEELRDILRQHLAKDFPDRQRIITKVNDLMVECRKCRTTFDIVSEEVSGIESSYGHVLNYRLNDTMMFLTIWSLILAVPPIISGFYGMNTYLPLGNQHLAWVYSLLMTFAIITGIIVLFKIHQRHQR